jgi:hypothetical protein
MRRANGAPMIEAFLAEPDIRKAVTGFCEPTVKTGTNEQRLGCLMGIRRARAV